MWSRRALLQALGAAAGAATLGVPGVVQASSDAPRLVLIILRGGMDGLAAVVPYGDPSYAGARGKLAMNRGDLLDLDGLFGLHPALAPLHELYVGGELLPMHALGVADQRRSHFDAQKVLENGTDRAGGASDGWLNRALGVLPGARGVAIGAQVPLVLRGGRAVQALNPRRTASAHRSLFDDVAALYETDPELDAALRSGLDSLQLLPEGSSAALQDRVVRAVASAAAQGSSVVAMGVGGWDTHVAQGTVSGGLANRLEGLAAGLVRLRAELGPAWSSTVVMVVTEFGRRVAANGTGGSDHGTGGAGFLLGGAVRGGRVLADWPGLAPRDLVRSRDLRPTMDVRSVFKGVLHHHMRVARADLDGSVFPGSAKVGVLDGIVRG